MGDGVGNSTADGLLVGVPEGSSERGGEVRE